MNRIIATIFLVFSTSICVASDAQESRLYQLPFNIELGKSMANEIENFGKCEEKVKVREYFFRCARYLITGNISVYMSQNGMANKMYIGGDYLPRKWKRLGLVKGLSKEKYISLAISLGGKYIEEGKDKYGNTTVEFEINNYLYKTNFTQFNSSLGGLSHIEVSLSY